MATPVIDLPSENFVDSIINEVRKPIIIDIQGCPTALIPDGYKMEDLEHLLPSPQRKTGTVVLTDTASFIDFVKRDGSLATCRIYVAAEYATGKVSFTAVLNDHAETQPHWRDYRAVYEPVKSVEWITWRNGSGRQMSQNNFATFLEDNAKDIATVADMPSGADMYALALNFQSKQEIIIKSHIRQQSGTVEFTYTTLEDDATVQKMEIFQRFALGIAPFFNGKTYQLNARLKYTTAAGKPTFWYELVRPDLVLQDATQGLIETIKKETGFPLFFGNP